VQIFGFEISLRRATAQKKELMPVDSGRGWSTIIHDWVPGAWQANEEISVPDTLTYWAVFRCISIIASDIAKLRMRLVRLDDGIWSETKSPAFSPVLTKPNANQTRIQFFANWMESKLTRGNTYVLKERDGREVVTALWVLDPMRVTPLVSETGAVFYEIHRDDFVGVGDSRLIVPASEIIHDRWNTLYHPLVGLSPIYANGIAALTAMRIARNSAKFYANEARPSGILTAPGAISDETAVRLKQNWQTNYTGENRGRVAVLGDGLKFDQLTMTATDAQMIEQLKWTDQIIAGAFGVPSYMINAGPAPSYQNVEALQQQFYSQCLQIHLESIELLLDEGLGLNAGQKDVTYGSEFELDGLLRMDTATKVRTAVEGLKGLFTSNEIRRSFDLPPVEGGDAVMSQQQNYSLEALAKRDAKEDPFGAAKPAPAAPKPPPVADDEPVTPAAAARALKSALGLAALNAR